MRDLFSLLLAQPPNIHRLQRRVAYLEEQLRPRRNAEKYVAAVYLLVTATFAVFWAISKVSTRLKVDPSTW